MRHLLLTLLILLGLGSLLTGLPVRAEENNEASLFQITDIAVDVTAENATAAKDQAIIQANRNGFEQLLSRLGVDSGLAAKQSDDAIALLVQAFEVQQERRSAVHYIGTFTVQFKPNAVRNLLNKTGASYSETRSKPMVVLPIVSTAGRNILWEDSTKWRSAWENDAKNAGLVPIVMPAGDLDDIALISTAEAISGKAESMQALMHKYQANGVMVAIVKANLDHPDGKQEFQVTAIKYDSSGKSSEPISLTPESPADMKAEIATLAQLVKQLRGELENGWKQVAKPTKGSSIHLPVNVPIDTLAQWNIIKRKLGNITSIGHVDIISVTRGLAQIELEFRGEVPELAQAVQAEGLLLAQERDNGWVLRLISNPTTP